MPLIYQKVKLPVSPVCGNFGGSYIFYVLIMDHSGLGSKKILTLSLGLAQSTGVQNRDLKGAEENQMDGVDYRDKDTKALWLWHTMSYRF